MSSPFSIPVIDTVDEDVFQLIAYQLYYGTTGALTQLAFTSRRLRCLCMPTLFSNCGAYYSGQQGLPPITIRTFVRHLTYYGECDQRHCEDVFGKELACLPALRRITFAGPNFGVPWPVLKRCLAVPNLIGIQFSAPARFAYVTPYPNEEIAGLQLALKSLSYTPYPWRLMTDSLAYLPSLPPYYVGPEVEIALEDRCLPPLVCKMHLTAEYLKLPAETAPLARMCNTPWPSLRELHLCGRLPDDIELPLLRRLIPHLPQIHTLMLEVCQSKAKTDRLSVLGRASYAPDRPLTLQTLSIAYPDPQDSIIAAVSGTHLTSLSLCDYPRFYIHRTSSMIHWRWSAPILSSSDCLVMLRRMRLPHLRRLELVYETDGSDDELLQHVATAFSGLSHLALHRYRQDRTQSVLYLHIARLLTSAKSLRTIRLHLDFPEDPGPYSEDPEARARWLQICDDRGMELAALLEDCPLLEHVALLVHGLYGSLWFEFYPPRRKDPRVCCAGQFLWK